MKNTIGLRENSVNHRYSENESGNWVRFLGWMSNKIQQSVTSAESSFDVRWKVCQSTKERRPMATEKRMNRLSSNLIRLVRVRFSSRVVAVINVVLDSTFENEMMFEQRWSTSFYSSIENRWSRTLKGLSSIRVNEHPSEIWNCSMIKNRSNVV